MKIGIDVGSTGIKIVFVETDQVVWKTVVPTKPGQDNVVNELIKQGLNACSISPESVEKTCVTGYGRNLIQSSNHVVDEISANAAGIYRVSGGKARTVINIGGQDVKIIKLNGNGQVIDFRMNDKCAAGTGRFFEIAAKILDTPLHQFHVPSDHSDPTVNINATCAVFAESEMVSLIAKGVSTFSMIRGINQAVAKRISNLAGNSLPEPDIYVDGGPALNPGLVESLEDELLCDLHVAQAPQFTVAYGSLYVD